MIEQLTHNWLCWGIVVLAMFCYQQLWSEVLFIQVRKYQVNEYEILKSQQQQSFTRLLIGVLPLLGLLGTIVGLLECFAGMARGGASSELISRGIGDALITTQLGITCAIPAWLLHAYVKACWQRTFIPNQSVSVANIATDKVKG